MTFRLSTLRKNGCGKNYPVLYRVVDLVVDLVVDSGQLPVTGKSTEISAKISSSIVGKSCFWEKYGVASIGVFGSWARGEGRQDIDIDIIVDLYRPIGRELVDLSDYLESCLGQPVDPVLKRSIHPLIRDAILAEVLYA